MNLIRNNLVANKAVQWDTKIYVPDIGQLKARRNMRQLNPVVDTSVDIPDELLEVKNDVTIAMDGLTINGLIFLFTISLHNYFMTMHYMTNTTAGYYQQALNKINSVYKRGVFDSNKIRCDNEFS